MWCLVSRIVVRELHDFVRTDPRSMLIPLMVVSEDSSAVRVLAIRYGDPFVHEHCSVGSIRFGRDLLTRA